MLSEQTRALAEALAETSDEAIVLVGEDGQPYFARGGDPVAGIVRRKPEQILADLDSVLFDADLTRVRNAYTRLFKTPGRREAVSFWLRHPDGHMVQLRALGMNSFNEALGAILIRVAVVSSQPAMPRFGSDTDPPAQEHAAGDTPSWRSGALLSRGEFLDTLQRVVNRKEEKIWRAPSFARAVAKDRRYDYAVVLMEIDRKDMLRGNFAQDVIEKTVMQVAERLSGALRGRDAIGYLGGTELAILIDGVGDVAHALRVTDDYLAIMAEPFNISTGAGGEQVLTLSAALGIATSERRYDKAEDVVRDATAAVTRSVRKKRGSRRMVFDTAMRLEDKKNLALMSDLATALAKRELRLAYQPIVRLSDGSLAGFEALARWNHPAHGAIPPSEIIALAEEMGHIRELGRWVLNTACRAFAGWCAGDDIETPPLMINVNVSPLQLIDETFRNDVLAALDKSGLRATQLLLDITESALMQDRELTRSTLQALERVGVSFALDDFGTGYSSLSLLHERPYDRLKIDRALVEQATRTGDPLKVLTAIVRMAQALSMEVIAEGVETEEQRLALSEIGCDHAQGYLFGLPMDDEEAAALLRSNPRW